MSRSDRFSEIYRVNWWGGNRESASGAGSTLANTAELRASLPDFLRAHGVQTFLDAPCGDLNWIKTTELPEGMVYIGADIVPSLIADLERTQAHPNRKFMVLDLVEDDYPAADMLMCRDCLLHLSHQDVFGMLRNYVKSGIPGLLTTYMPNVSKNTDIETGQYRPLNLTEAPYNLPAPQEYLTDYTPPRREKYLGFWTREQIAEALDKA